MTTFCNNCQASVPTANWNIHSLSCERQRRYCSKCDRVLLKCDYQEHLDKFHFTARCKCGKLMDASELSVHATTECPKKLIKCAYCNVPTYSEQISEHQLSCGARTTVCEYCNRRVQLHHMDDHCCILPQ